MEEGKEREGRKDKKGNGEKRMIRKKRKEMEGERERRKRVGEVGAG